MPYPALEAESCIAGIILPIETGKGLHQSVFTWKKMRLRTAGAMALAGISGEFAVGRARPHALRFTNLYARCKDG